MGLIAAFFAHSRRQLSVIRQFLDVVHQAIQLPLALHFFLTAQTEAIQALGRSDVAEHGFHHRHSVAVDLFASRAVNPVFHPVGVVRQSLVFDGERHLSARPFAVID